MRTPFFLIFLGLCVASLGNPTARIVGGREAPDGKYPYQVFLKYSGKFLCGGSILNNRYILTAAHCIKGKSANQMTVTVGTNLNIEGQGQTYQAERLIPHKKYIVIFIYYDIGLIRLSTPIEFNEKVKPISLPHEEFKSFDTSVKLTGWGQLTDWGAAPKDLQEIDLKVIPSLRCRRDWLFIRSHHICTLTKRGEGACFGDSGGPLVAADGSQIGIVSFGSPCGVGKADVFTKVYSFLGWIRDNTRE